MSTDRELLEFDGNILILTIVGDDLTELKKIWHDKVQSVQPPLVSAHKNGLHIHLPWITEGHQDEAKMD